MFVTPGNQAFCSSAHAVEYAISIKDKALARRKAANDREFRKETKARKNKIKSKGDWAKEAQQAFNRYIRLRDHGQPCISCQRHHQGQYHAGHYKSVGAHPELRFEESQVHLQCQPCNAHLSGNILNYRPNLIERIGLERVEWIEGPHEPKRYSIEDLQAIKAKYKKMGNALAKSI